MSNIRLLDWGISGEVSNNDLRQIRADFTSTLPFQAIECYLAFVKPIPTAGKHFIIDFELLVALVLLSRVLTGPLP